MEPAKAAGLIFLGAILLYIGIFGVTASPFRYAVTGNLLKEDWNSIGNWVSERPGLSEINPASQLHMAPTLATDTYRSERILKEPYTPTVGSKFTVEFRLQINSYSSSKTIFGVHIRDIYYDAIVISRSEVACVLGGSYDWKSLQTDTNWHTWTFSCDSTGLKELSRDGIKVAEWNGQSITVTVRYIHITFHFELGGDPSPECHMDYLYIDSGTVTPSPPSQDVGTINLYAWDGTNYVTASLSMTFPDGTVKTATTPYVNTNAPIGSYQVTCIYNSVSKPHSFTLTKGAIESKTFDFSGGTQPPPPTPPPETDWLEQIRAFFQQPVVKSLFIMGGVGCVGFGFISLAFRKKRPSYPVYSPY